MKSGHSYLQYDVNEEAYDVIVIGSGIGGLSVAAILAKAGKKVLVLEKHYTAGGFTHTFKRKDYEWDVGLHYVGDVHIPGTVMNKAFRYITDGKLKWAPMPEVYDKAVFGDQTYEFISGRERFKAKLKDYFPGLNEQQAIDAYFELLKQVQQLGSNFYIEKALPPLIADLTESFLKKGVLKYADRTTLSVLQELTDNTTLIGVLTAQYGDYGLPPGKSSFYMHAMLANHYMEGAAYPVGGAGSIANNIIPVIEEVGGIVLTHAEVDSILIHNNRAVGVKMEDGKTIHSKIVISDAGVISTFSTLMPGDSIRSFKFKEQLLNLDPAAAHVALYVGIKQSAESLGLPKHNYWLFPDEYDHDKLQDQYVHPNATLPVAYISFPSAKDPAWENRYPGTATIEVITLVPYEWFLKWEGADWKNRGAEYDALKKKLAHQLLAQLYRILPQLKGKIDYYELSTPLSTYTFTGHHKGAIYGIAHNPKRFRQKILRARTPIKNLYLTGQDIVIASIGGGLMGGILSASAILKKNMFNYILQTKTTNE